MCMIYRVQEHLIGAISLADFYPIFYIVPLCHMIYFTIVWNFSKSLDLNSKNWRRLTSELCTHTDFFVFPLMFRWFLIFVRSFFCSSFLYHILPPGPSCSLLTSCSSCSCCYLRPRLVSKVETPARLIMATCHQHLPPLHPRNHSWIPVWLRPSRLSSWTDWACTLGPTRSQECRCQSTSLIFIASISSSTI